jgi:hypothetical protein
MATITNYPPKPYVYCAFDPKAHQIRLIHVHRQESGTIHEPAIASKHTDRWWYDFLGKTYYVDCDLSDWTLEHHHPLLRDWREYQPLAKRMRQETGKVKSGTASQDQGRDNSEKYT